MDDESGLLAFDDTLLMPEPEGKFEPVIGKVYLGVKVPNDPAGGTRQIPVASITLTQFLAGHDFYYVPKEEVLVVAYYIYFRVHARDTYRWLPLGVRIPVHGLSGGPLRLDRGRMITISIPQARFVDAL